MDGYSLNSLAVCGGAVELLADETGYRHALKSDTPIVFVHQGRQWYLPYVLDQARSASPDSNIVLIGDELDVQGVRLENTATLADDALRTFRRCYSHMSTVPEHFEMFCWERWFYLRQFLTTNRIESILHLDSDVLLSSSITEIANAYSDTVRECGLSISGDNDRIASWAVSAHASYWTIDILDEFCDFVIDSFQREQFLELYRKKFDWHQAHGVPGGVCDMTTLYFFWKENKQRISNLARCHAGGTFDHNIALARNSAVDEYLTESGVKKIEYINGHPHFFRADRSGRLDRAHVLHFQGAAKRRIKTFYTGGALAIEANAVQHKKEISRMQVVTVQLDAPVKNRKP